MGILELLTDISAKLNTQTVVFTGICNINRWGAVYKALSPSNASAVGRMSLSFDRHPDIPYRYEMATPQKAAADYSDNSIDVLYIGNHKVGNDIQAELSAWLPKMISGGYIICYNAFADSNVDFVQVDENAQDYPENWYLIKS